MSAKHAKTAFLVAALLAVLVTAILAWLYPYAPDPEAKVVWYKRVPGFAAMLGFVGCMVMVPVVKTLAKKLLQRPEDHYATYEARLAVLAGAPPGHSLADPSAPSEAEPAADEEVATKKGKDRKKKGGHRG